MGSDKRNFSRARNRRAVNGLLLLDKQPGLTSNQALQQVKRLFSARKAGHTGSLDPLASGMLPVCFGQATKLSRYLLGADKLYLVTAQFGAQTDTADADGKVIAEVPDGEVSKDALLAALSQFHGSIDQIPPMYSALKKDGRRLYELARQGKEVFREARTVRIHALELVEYHPQRPVFRVHCSKGTYVRTLVEDIAKAAGTLGHVAALRRLAVFPFREEAMVTAGQLEKAAEQGTAALDACLLPVDDAISDWPAVRLGKAESYYLLQGHPVSSGPAPDPGLVRLYDEGQRFLGIGEVLMDGRVAPRRLFVERKPGAAP
jgi:tRNA pseudouridine55 synthase